MKKLPKLETGMLVEILDISNFPDDNPISYGMVINDFIVLRGDHDSINDYDEFGLSEYFKITRVSKVLLEYELRPENWNRDTLEKNILWDCEDNEKIFKLDGIEYSESSLRSIIKKAHEIRG